MKKLVLAALAFGILQVATAQDGNIEEESYEAFSARVLEGVSPETGAISLSGAPVTLDVPASFHFYDAAESRTILEDLWGNPPDTSVLGMLFPADVLPQYAPWGAVLTYEASGYVSDEDAHEINFDDILEQMKRDAVKANREREKLGYETVELVGWAVPPRYHADSHRIDWAKDLIFASSNGEHTINYDMRVLGRRGVFSINFVAGVDSLENIKSAAPAVLEIPVFKQGETYADYQEGDKLAGYGLAALVTGATATAVVKKTGFLAVLVLFLKKGWIIIVAGLGMALRWFRNSFGGRE